MTRVPTCPTFTAPLTVNEAANPLTYLHSAGRLLLLHHVAAHTLENFSVGEVGAVQCLHVGVRGAGGADDPAGVLQILPLLSPVQGGVRIPPGPAAEQLQHLPRRGLSPALWGCLWWIY